jgi:hypothetical protein
MHFFGYERKEEKKKRSPIKKSSIIFHHTPHQEKIDIVVLPTTW